MLGYSRAVYSDYCKSATAPTLPNANAPTPVTYLGGKTYYTCNQVRPLRCPYTPTPIFFRFVFFVVQYSTVLYSD